MSQALAAGTDVPIASLGARAFEIPLDAPESDGTAEWDSTVMVVVEAHAGGETGLGYTYGSARLPRPRGRAAGAGGGGA